jgi:uncharacterized OB-fold protein
MNGPGTAGYLTPAPNRDTAPWWDAMAQGRLTIPECEACRRRFFPPQPFCPHCGADRWRLAPVRGDGRVYSWVVVHRSFAPEFDKDVPYGIVAVDLRAGGRLIGRYLGELDDLRAGLAVVAEVECKDGFGLLWFAAAKDQSGKG